MGNPYLTGVMEQEQIDICVWHCDHPLGCVGGGDVFPERQRCALERHLAGKLGLDGLEPAGEMPGGFVTVTELVERLGLERSTIIKRIHRGVYPDARKAGQQWIIPEGQV